MLNFEILKRTTRPCSIHRNPGMSFADYDSSTSYARGRVLQILQSNGYRTVIPGKFLPSFDLIHYCELIPYTVDLYALQYHKESKRAIVDEMIVDIRRKQFDGLTIVPYDLSMSEEEHLNQNEMVRRRQAPLKPGYRRKAFVEHANQYKKQMICSHYNIDPKRYIIIDEQKLFSREWALPTVEIENMLFADKVDTTVRSKDDLFVELPA